MPHPDGRAHQSAIARCQTSREKLVRCQVEIARAENGRTRAFSSLAIAESTVARAAILDQRLFQLMRLIADDKVMYYFVPRMIKYYLDQTPIIV